jgi:hypothetical protein
MTTVEIISLAGSLIGLGCGVTALASTVGRGIAVDDLQRRMKAIERKFWPGGPVRPPGYKPFEMPSAINLPHVPDDWKAGDR